MAHSRRSSQGRPYYPQDMMHSEQSPPLSPGAYAINLPPVSSSFMSAPLPIRGAQTDEPPPPIPPPRDGPPPAFGNGADTWANRHAYKGTGSFKPGSSLLGTSAAAPRQFPHRRNLSKSMVSVPSPLREDDQIRSIKKEDSDFQLPGFHNIMSERPLDMHNHQKSTEAYDKQMLSKIGQPARPKTPVRSSTLGNEDISPIGKVLRVDTQPPPMHRLSLADRSLSAHPESPFRSPWGNSPRWPPSASGTISPSMNSSASASTRSLSLAELRSPQSSYEPSTAPSSLSAGQFSRMGSFDRGSNASLSLLSSAFDEAEHKNRHFARSGPTPAAGDWSSRSNRGGSFDHRDPIFPGDEHDSEFAAAAHARSHFAAADPRDYPHLAASDSSLSDIVGPQGVKRKASPSVGDIAAGEQPPHTRSRTPGPGRGKRTSPGHQAHVALPPYGSHSASSVHTASYASSNLSLAPSSVTSYGTPDYNSPTAAIGGLGEHTDGRHPHSSYGVSASLDASVSQSSLPSSHHTPSQSTASSVSQHDVGSGKPGRDGGIAAAHIHVCDCCPKKPKKFNTLAELETHRREKQFYCTYCHNRFKNKNEAERHQNSLHLRKQSWSCATLGNKINRAFHPCTATPSVNPHQASQQDLPPAEFDVCGYCGKQFPNYPNPDWAERNKHLTEVHKFGECNQSKKFFRADHFRQHLKHSHQGSSGKWTNMLELACLRDEPPPGVVEPAPAASHDSIRQQQQHASQGIHSAKSSSQHSPNSSYQAEVLQATAGGANLPARQAYPSAIGSHVQYEPKIDEEDEARD